MLKDKISRKILGRIEKNGPIYMNILVEACQDVELPSIVIIGGIWSLAAGGFIDIVEGKVIIPLRNQDNWSDMF